MRLDINCADTLRVFWFHLPFYDTYKDIVKKGALERFYAPQYKIKAL